MGAEAAERFLSEARAALRSRGGDLRVRAAGARKLACGSIKECALDLAKDLYALRKMHAEVDAAPLAATERSTGLAKTLEDRDVTLQRAERKIEALEAKLAKQQKDALGEQGCLRRRSPNSSSSSSWGSDALWALLARQRSSRGVSPNSWAPGEILQLLQPAV